MTNRTTPGRVNQVARQRYLTDGVGSASAERLVILLFERLLRDLDEAQAALLIGERDRAHERLLNGQDILTELDIALDVDQWEPAGQLRAIYRYSADLLVRANVRRDVEAIDEARRVLTPLAETWRSAYQQALGVPV
ncbi:MAG: flagellar export chaperone FliS [Actinomycetia bacterium]|nr:flagellar export chaperone FliS [Actinomycetes bacterium]